MTRFHIKEDSESVVAGAESFREMQKLVEDKKKETKDSAIITVLTLLSVWTFFLHFPMVFHMRIGCFL